MWDSSRAGVNVFTDHYRCAPPFGDFEMAERVSANSGYFRLGKSAVCYGHNSAVYLQPTPDNDLYDALHAVAAENGYAALPFDLDEVIDNLRYERYAATYATGGLAKDIYSLFRPLMPVAFRKHLQRRYLKDWKGIAFPDWPVDRTVENILEEMVILSLRSQRVDSMPFVWFWPDGYSACAIVTHDIETKAGRDFCGQLIDMDQSFGIRSSFQVVPEKRYTVPQAFLDELRSRGCEVNLHGLNHDGLLFRDRKEFLRQAKQINRYAREYGALGFRSPVLYRNLDWYDSLDFAYDMSVPNVAHLEPQRGGCCTVMPYFVGSMVELPLTMTQDYSLFHILGDYSIDLWKKQIDLVTEKHGLVSFNTHPDYLIAETCRDVYRQLLRHLIQVCRDRKVWLALPGEVADWWKQRQEMRVVNEQGILKVTGPRSERAVVAYASQRDGQVIYEQANRIATMEYCPHK
jgi:hypothetical protein